MSRFLVIPIIALLVIVLDLYIFQGVKAATQNLSPGGQKITRYIYWGVTALAVLSLLIYFFGNTYAYSKLFKNILTVTFFTHVITKVLFMLPFVLLDDIWRLGQWGYQQITVLFSGTSESIGGEPITRSEFLGKTSLALAAVPIVGVSWGIISGAHDYRVRRKTIYLPHLPREFDGIQIGQLSDIHSGSFWNKTAVQGGVELLNRQKPDVVFFTGDLVNNRAEEMGDYMYVFDKVQAPLGTYSILGNHDYGDYVEWDSAAAKQQNLERLKAIHKNLGWNLLMNEHIMLKEGNESIAVLGIENWGAKGRFPKYGKMAEAYRGAEEAPVKLLLSHDPSHWDAEVRQQYKDIDIMFAGHTHGMQFGVEVAGVKWSPVQYMYDQWADLYSAQNQHLYVNRGFGYIGYPGRIGMPPEITIMELKRGEA